jgi:ABC-type phosphate transport system substrate-binding protein
MYLEADGILPDVNAVINSNGLLTALLAALVVAIIGWGIGALRRRHQQARYPGRFRAGLALVMVLALGFSAAGGVALANRALAPAPVCAPGKVDFDGSTAFAPIINEVATEYEQDCPQAQIAVRAIGSSEGQTVLQQGNNETPVVAMLDGQPRGLPSPQYVGQPVGVIIFAVVGNRDSLPSQLFAAGIGGGLSTAQITQAFEHGVVSGITVRPVGRTRGSGTRNDFTHDVLGRQYPSSGICPQPHGVCDEPTTLDLLTYVNNTKNAIGYAEADALPFFPSVAAIPIRVHGIGYEPTRSNTLNGDYSFFAIEYLYTRGLPGGLEADIINFLMSKPVAAQLRDTSFISCSDVKGSNLSPECPVS